MSRTAICKQLPLLFDVHLQCHHIDRAEKVPTVRDWLSFMSLNILGCLANACVYVWWEGQIRSCEGKTVKCSTPSPEPASQAGQSCSSITHCGRC